MEICAEERKLTPFKLSVARVLGNEYNTDYPDIAVIKNEIDLRKANQYDHVCASFKNNHRKGNNFISGDCLYADVDNDDTKSEESLKYWDDPQYHMTIEKFKKEFKDYEYVLYTSRNHGIDKKKTIKNNGVEKKVTRMARDKYHVIFPLGKEIVDVDELKSKLTKLTETYKFFDPQVKDASRFFYGNPDAEIYWNSGRSIEEKLNQIESKEKVEKIEDKKIPRFSIIPEVDSKSKNENFEWFDLDVVPKLKVHEVFKDVGNLKNGNGQQLTGCCPFHSDKRPSFSVNGRTLTWICHSGCGQGNVIEYLSRIRTVERSEAVDQLCKKAGVENQFKEKQGTKNTSVKLIDMINVEDLFHDKDGTGYFWRSGSDHADVVKIKSNEFQEYLTYTYFKKNNSTVGTQAVNEAVAVLKAKAKKECAEREVFYRIGKQNNNIYLDLRNDAGEVIEISASGWNILDSSPIPIRRTAGSRLLPRPVRDGNLEVDLKPLLNLVDDNDWKCLVGWLIGAMQPSGPYPLLVIQGEQGSAKSTMAKLVKRIIDPADPLLRSIPGDERDQVINAFNSWVLAYDNLSGLSHAQSDILCRLSTNGGFATRKLFSDNEEMIFRGERPIILNGIDDIATRHDLADRSIVLNLRSISNTERRTEKELSELFESKLPSILGCLCDALSCSLRKYDSVVLDEKPRMADFVIGVSAAEETLGWNQGDFLKAYSENIEQTKEQTVENDEVATAIVQFMTDSKKWNGSATILLSELESVVSETIQRNKRAWPQAPNALSKRVRRAAPALRDQKVEITFERKGKSREIFIENRMKVSW